MLGYALHLFETIVDPFGQAQSHDNLDHAHHQLGDYRQAVADYEQSIALWREVGNLCQEALAHECLGDTYGAVDHPALAHRSWRHALAILEQLDKPAAHRLRSRLFAHESTPAAFSTAPAP